MASSNTLVAHVKTGAQPVRGANLDRIRLTEVSQDSPANRPYLSETSRPHQLFFIEPAAHGFRNLMTVIERFRIFHLPILRNHGVNLR